MKFGKHIQFGAFFLLTFFILNYHYGWLILKVFDYAMISVLFVFGVIFPDIDHPQSIIRKNLNAILIACSSTLLSLHLLQVKYGILEGRNFLLFFILSLFLYGYLRFFLKHRSMLFHSWAGITIWFLFGIYILSTTFQVLTPISIMAFSSGQWIHLLADGAGFRLI